MVFGQTLFFSSGRDRNGVAYRDGKAGDLVDIYCCELKDSVHFKKPKPFTSVLNSKYNDCPGSFSKDANEFFMSRNYNLKESSGKPVSYMMPLKIYSARKKSPKQWHKPQPLPFCKGDNNYCHPVLMKDQQTIVFASDMPGGYGGMDLYYSKFENGQWSEPKNFGAKINTTANEFFPFISVNNLLFFSSDRKGGYGGLDIYRFDLDNPVDSKVMLMDAPINSSFDDFGIWTDSTSESGYFSSNRNIKTGDDIYYFKMVHPDFKAYNAPKTKDKFCYTFFEEASLETLDTTGLSYEWNFGDGQKARSLRARHCFNKPGEYKVQLNIVEKNSGQVFMNETSYNLVIEPPKKIVIECSDTACIGSEVMLSALRSELKGYKLLHMYWSFGDGKYNTGPEVKHVFRKDGEYTVELGVIAQDMTTNKTERFRIEKKILVKPTL